MQMHRASGVNDKEMDHCLETAIQAAEAAGREARSRFGAIIETRDKGPRDITTEVDDLCEEIIVELIAKAHPNHHIWSEEGGSFGTESEWSWTVDPLDGTNNYAMGLPLYGCIIAASFRGTQVVGAVHDAHNKRTIAGRQGGGVYEGERKIQMSWSGKSPSKMTIGWTQGYGVGLDPTARAMRDHIEANCKRVIANWSPVIDTGLILTGGMDAIVSYDAERTDLSAASVLIPEAGGKVADFQGKDADFGPRIIVGHQQAVDALADILSR